MEREGRIDFDTVLLLVGRLNYAWTNTESLLIHLIAGLSGTDKEIATVTFLTLNTTRARIDLVERLSKLDRIAPAQRKDILGLTGRIQRHSALRNRYNHCIYAFDPDGRHPRTIQMRIADRKDRLLMGQDTPLDAAALDEIRAALDALAEINRDIWQFISVHNYPV
ncbi:hypothetical protein ACM25N_04920 [Roseovarius sp. C7]|uniref:hypothetical protein n=1 Tax=Roseovarius sp. C7 TaxID=3398643 RepID=UPI0039F55D69